MVGVHAPAPTPRCLLPRTLQPALIDMANHDPRHSNCEIRGAPDGSVVMTAKAPVGDTQPVCVHVRRGEGGAQALRDNPAGLDLGSPKHKPSSSYAAISSCHPADQSRLAHPAELWPAQQRAAGA